MRRKIQLPKWPPGRPGIRAKLILSFLIVAWPAFLLLAVADYRQYAGQHQSAAGCLAVAQAVAASLRARLDQATGVGLLAVASQPGATPSPAAATSVLQDLVLTHPEYLDAFILDARGQLLAFAPSGRQPLVHPDTLAKVAQAEGPVLSDLFLSPPENEPVIQALVPLRSLQGPAGVAGVTIRAQALGSRVASAALAHGYHIVICDSRGQAIYSSLAPDLPWEARDLFGQMHIRQALQGQPALAPGMISHLDGRLYNAAAVPLIGTGWAVGVSRPARDLLDFLLSRAVVGTLLFAGLTILALTMAWSTGNWLASTISRLAGYARGLGRGQLNERIAIGTGDGFEDLSTALNSMARQMEERNRRLRARSAELDAIITQSADGIAIHGPAGELQRLNPAGIRILGRASARFGLLPAEQATWLNIRTAAGSAIEPEDLPVSAALRGETRVGQELRVETENGQERFVAFSAAPLCDARGRIYGAVTILRDMTLAHQAQQEKDDFISVVSHELKTPITAIKGYAQMLLRRAEDARCDEKDLKGLRIINDEVERMVELINQLLDVSRLETQRLQLSWDRVDLVALVLDAVDRLQMTTNRHTLQARVPQYSVWVRGDAMRLAQVLGNLIMNAIKYSPAGGPVEISLEKQEGQGWISVRDWGIGIAPEDHPHVFQRFWRATRQGNTTLTGMGLGLYISREIVQRHHGDIVFHSQPRQGTTFLFWLPLQHGDEPTSTV